MIINLGTLALQEVTKKACFEMQFFPDLRPEIQTLFYIAYCILYCIHDVMTIPCNFLRKKIPKMGHLRRTVVDVETKDEIKLLSFLDILM
jgi:hypothetical protein